MIDTSSKYDQFLDQVRAAMERWDKEGKVGEIALIRGQNQWEPEERERRKLKAQKHEHGGKAIVTENG